MAEATQFTIGAEVSCRDGACGEVIRLVVNPIVSEVTHIVVEPRHREGIGRLVPLELVASSTDTVTLSCTLAEFERLAYAEEIHFLPGTGLQPDLTSGEVLVLPYYGLGPGNVTPPVTMDALPLGEVAVRRDEVVDATDGQIGRVQGLVMDPATHHVTHVLLQEGHLWGRKEVAIPIGAVITIEEGRLRLNLTKKEVEDLPAVDVHDLTGKGKA
jgi:PRC-barrel domain